MKAFEEKLRNLSLPHIKDESFQLQLYTRMKNEFFTGKQHYIAQFRWAVSFACLFLILLAVIFIKPEMIVELHHFVFQNNQPETLQNIVPGCQLHDNTMNRRAGVHTRVVNSIDPSLFQENQTYVVRKYRSNNQKTILIVSEYDQPKSQNSKARIGY